MALSQSGATGQLPGLTLKAWVLFVGATGAITKSSGISGLVRNSAGNWTITFAAPTVSTYAIQPNFPSIDSVSGLAYSWSISAKTAASVTVFAALNGSGPSDIGSGNYIAFYE